MQQISPQTVVRSLLIAIQIISQHRLQIIGHLEGCFRLALDLVYSHTLRVLNQRQAVGKVDVEYSLIKKG